MVEINNQRERYDMLAWSEELTSDVRKPKCGYDVIVGGGYLLITPITLIGLSR